MLGGIRSAVLAVALSCIGLDSFVSGAFPSRVGPGLVGPTEAALLVLCVLPPGAARLRNRPGWRRLVRTGWLLLLGLTIAALAHPTAPALTTVVRWAVAMVVVAQTAREVATGRWRWIAYPLVVAVGMQAVIVAAQLATGGTIGLGALGEASSSFKHLGSFTAAPGTTTHPNEMAIFAVCIAAVLLTLLALLTTAAKSPLVATFIGLAACGFLVGQSTSRTALLGLLAMLGLGVASRRRRFPRAALGILAFGTAVGMAIARDGWMDRVTQSASTSAAAVGSGRVALARQAVALFRSHPVFGVGPGNWVAGVLADPRIERMTPERLPVHNVLLYTLALLGMVGTALALPAAIEVIRNARRIGALGALLLVPAGIALTVDIYLLVFNGRTVLAVVVGTVVGLRLRVDPPNAPAERDVGTHIDESVAFRPFR